LPESAEAYASRLARERRLQVCLVLSRRITVYIDMNGDIIVRQEATLDVPCAPYRVVGGRKVHFGFVGGEVLRPIDELGP
jgi:hypothetical protein